MDMASHFLLGWFGGNASLLNTPKRGWSSTSANKDDALLHAAL
jgi:hypothetical protein